MNSCAIRLQTLSSHLPEDIPVGVTHCASVDQEQNKAIAKLKEYATKHGLDIAGGKVRRTSSRCCLGVEHGDYNGTELFGVGTDRFIWLAYKKRSDNKVRIGSVNFLKEAPHEWTLGDVPGPKSPKLADSWGRFPIGADWVLHQRGYKLTHGFDAVVYGNIPGGGMSRSASLSINLVETLLECSGLSPKNYPVDENGKSYEIVALAQSIETDYIGSPSGYLDQIMIYYAKEGLGTHYVPATNSVRYVKLGCDSKAFSIGALDTGTDRPGLEKSTYAIRSRECKELSALLSKRFPGVKTFADLTEEQYATAVSEYSAKYPNHVDRLKYIRGAMGRFSTMLNAWKAGDIATVGKVFREDGIGLRDVYKISGPELETMCDIVRTVPGVYGERMLGGGDKGASGCLIASGSEPYVLAAVATAYPRAVPAMANKWAVHFVKVCDGVSLLENLL